MASHPGGGDQGLGSRCNSEQINACVIVAAVDVYTEDLTSLTTTMFRDFVNGYTFEQQQLDSGRKDS